MEQSDLTTTPGGMVSWDTRLPGGSSLRFIAEEVRPQHTGVHARVRIIKNTTRLDSDVFNIGRRGDRNALANSAYDLGFAPEPGHEPVITKQDLRHELMLFCDLVYPAIQGEIRPVHILGDSTPITFLAKPHVVEGGGSILFGPGGSGKSTTMLVCALSIQYGLSRFWDCTRANVLYVNVERSLNSIARRVGGIAPALGLPHDTELLSLSERGRTILELVEKIDEIVRERDIEVVFFDSLTRAGLGDLNDNKPANNFSDLMNKIAPTWVAIGHVARRDQSHVYGSVMFENAADVMVALKSHEDRNANKLGIRMDISKSNDAPKNVPPVWIRYDYDAQTNSLIGIGQTSEREFPDLATQVIRQGSVPDQIEAYLTDEAQSGRASAATISTFLEKERPNISAILNSNPRFVKVGTEGRSVLYGLATTEDNDVAYV